MMFLDDVSSVKTSIWKKSGIYQGSIDNKLYEE